MAITIEVNDEREISLEEFMAYADQFESVEDEEVLCEMAPVFKRLLNNRRFVVDALNKELASWRDFQRGNRYTGAVLMLAHSKNYYIRANVWAPPTDYGDARVNDNEVYSYQIPHDHNFSFLTGGYYGSGYATTLYEWEDDAIRYTAKDAPIRFLENTTLPTGKIMVYRRFKDIHSQEHAPDLSLSINVLPDFHTDERQFFFDFDERRVTAASPHGEGGRDGMCALAVGLKDARTVALLHDLATKHHDTNLRASALLALAQVDSGAAHAAFRTCMDELDGERRELVRLRCPEMIALG